MNSIETPVYFLTDKPYDGIYPKFYDKNDFGWVNSLESKYEIIREELKELTSDQFQFSNNINPPNLSAPNSWTNLYFFNFLWKNSANCNRFPKTYEIISSIPGVILAGVTVLKSNSSVLPHTGETNTTIRCHLGIEIPDSLPACGMQVGGEERSWQNGKVLLFNDAYTHSTWNNSEKNRVIILFDVVKEEYISQKYWIACKCLSTLSIKALRKKSKMLANKIGILNKFHNLVALFWFLFLPIQRNILKFKILSP